MIESLKGKWCVEYSVSQESFYYDTVERILQKNINAMKTGMSNDYKIVAIVKDMDEAFITIKEFQNMGAKQFTMKSYLEKHENIVADASLKNIG